jgi:cell division protein ZapA
MSRDSGVAVQVLDREYLIAAGEDQRAALLASADFLNGRLRELRRGGRVAGNERLLALVALNIAHELLQERAARQQHGATLERLRALEERLTAALQTLESPAHSG